VERVSGIVDAEVCRSWIDYVSLNIHFDERRSGYFAVLQSEWIDQEMFLVLACSQLLEIKFRIKQCEKEQNNGSSYRNVVVDAL
jgi:hypothetical protein